MIMKSVRKIMKKNFVVSIVGFLFLNFLVLTVFAGTINPGKLLIYYGWPIAINGTWSVASAAEDFGDYDYVILGNGLQTHSHASHSDTYSIMKHANAANVSFCGYITLGVSSANHPDYEIVDRISLWKDMGADCIFFDEAGYDFQVSRVRQNTAVEAVHERGLFVVINSWDIDDVMSPITNTTYNPNALLTELEETDFWLFESYQIKVGAYESESDWLSRADQVENYQEDIGIFITTTNNSSDVFSQKKFDYAYFSAALYGYDAISWGQYLYASNDASAPFRTRPSDDLGNSFTGEIIDSSPTFTRATSTGVISISTQSHNSKFME